MRLVIVGLAAVLSASVLAGPVAQAAETPQAAPAPSARQLELTRRYIALTMTDQFEDALRQIIVQQAQADPNADSLPEADREFIVELSVELTTDMIPQMLEAMVPIYARTFTEEELEAMIAFYDSEMGRSILRKTMTSLPEANQAAMSVMPQLMEKMAARICQYYGCEAEELEAVQRGMRGEIPVAPSRK